MAKGTWTPERVELLKDLWGAGRTAAEIAKQLGGNITRNAVIGKAHRLGLSGRVSPIQKKAKKTPRSVKPAAASTKKPANATQGSTTTTRAPARKPYVDKPKANGGVSLIDLKDRMCHWPIGDPKKPGFHFCGDRSVPGLPYCAEHAAVAYQGSARKFSVNAADYDENKKTESQPADALDLLDDALNA
jgi:GcrA cell cycle regulator